MTRLTYCYCLYLNDIDEKHKLSSHMTQCEQITYKMCFCLNHKDLIHENSNFHRFMDIFKLALQEFSPKKEREKKHPVNINEGLSMRPGNAASGA